MMINHPYKPIFYFSTTFFATFVLWFAGAYVSFQDGMSGLAYLFMLPGLMAPFLISIVMIARSGDAALKTDYLDRLVNLRRIRPRMLEITQTTKCIQTVILVIVAMGKEMFLSKALPALKRNLVNNPALNPC